MRAQVDRQLGDGQNEQFGDDRQSNEGVRSSPTQSTEQRFYILMQYLAAVLWTRGLAVDALDALNGMLKGTRTRDTGGC